MSHAEGADSRSDHVGPQFDGILESVLYYRRRDETAVTRFYLESLAMRAIGRSEGHHLFLRVGPDVLLLFEAESALRQDSPPPHGSFGRGHVCFVASGTRYEVWRSHLTQAAVTFTEETRWSGGGRSFYFHDPAGNVLEIADRDIWPR